MGIDTRKALAWGLGLWCAVLANAVQSASEFQPAEVRVGRDVGDFRGSDHRALQAAIDYVAALGGGTVRIGPGRYLMRNALALRDNIRVIGVPGKTVLFACNGFKTALAADGDCNERQVTVADPSGFQVGDGISIQDKSAASGFAVTTATVTARSDANTYLDNVFRNNTCSGNGAAGVFFRNEEEAMGAHRNVFEDNRILDNCVSPNGEAKASIVIRGHHHDLVFHRNVIGNSSPGGTAAIGILSSEYARGLKAEDNRFLNVKTEIETVGP